MKPRINMEEHASGAYDALMGLERWVRRSRLTHTTLHLVKIRASQINGCAFGVDSHSHEARRAGETDERLFSIAAWREAPYYTDAERAALALTEAATRLDDRADPVPDEIWDEAARHYDDAALAALVVAIAAINAWNRIGVTARLVAGSTRSHRTAA